MNSKILEQLELSKVLAFLAPFLQTQQGEVALSHLEPLSQRQKIENRFQELADMQLLFQEGYAFSIGQLSDISASLKRLSLDADLSIIELLDIKKTLVVASEIGRYYQGLVDLKLPALSTLFEDVAVFPALQGSLQSLNEGGFIESFASFELEKIRRQISQTQDSIRQILQTILKNQSAYLTDNLIASRAGRQVLPVKNTYRNRISGVVHDISSSGTTVYIEPRQVVVHHEELSRLQADEKQEEARILRELSARLRPHLAALKQNTWLFGQLDLIRAKYLFMRQYDAIIPELSKDKTIHLINVRHPLITDPVPNDLQFTADKTTILITGPNTGGKTIMLKTLGLTQLMAQSGLPILADSGSKVAIFTAVFADIGDEQSIEQSLSTFSSHMTHIISILEVADSDSLVLFDELGAGTDPKEGASLAMAILEQLRSKQIKTMATTHYPELKAYGLETAGIENASMAFDNKSLRPTYRFMQGVPGRSNAFEIARRLGLSDSIVSQAQAMTSQDKDVNQMIEQLEDQALERRRRLEHIKAVEQENLKFNRAVKKLYNDFRHVKDKALEEAHKEAREVVSLALEESDLILNRLTERSQLKPHEVIEAKSQLKKLAPPSDLTQNKVLKKSKAKRQAKEGDDIIVTAYGQRGTLLRRVKDKVWEAQIGLIKMTLAEEEFTLSKTDSQKQATAKKQVSTVRKKRQAKGQLPKARLDLRGKRYEAALEELDAFIDQALVNNISQVDIIHGIGTGVIRDAVQTYLRRHKHIKDFAYAPQSSGGSGCTIATLG